MIKPPLYTVMNVDYCEKMYCSVRFRLSNRTCPFRARSVPFPFVHLTVFPRSDCLFYSRKVSQWKPAFHFTKQLLPSSPDHFICVQRAPFWLIPTFIDLYKIWLFHVRSTFHVHLVRSRSLRGTLLNIDRMTLLADTRAWRTYPCPNSPFQEAPRAPRWKTQWYT